jgi:crotonobetainyl-CoA:carnitine CoA-transferase CaiB-like acyl-CoA transferase
VYCSISGYGQEGPYRDLPGHDLNYMAMAGMSQFFKDGEGNLVPPGVAIGDLSSGMFAALGILAAVMVKVRTGQGQYVDVSMFDGLLSWLSTYFGILSDTGKTERLYDAGYGIFEAGDGELFTIGIAHEDWFWERLCQAVGLAERQGLKGVARRERREELRAELQAVFSRKPREDWVRVLAEADVPVAPVQTLEQVARDPHVAFRQIIREIPSRSGKTDRHVGFPIQLSETPWSVRAPAPELGEHTDEILADIGYSTSEIQELRDMGAV